MNDKIVKKNEINNGAIFKKRVKVVQILILSFFLSIVLCVHCRAKHFPAEKVSNKGNSFNDCCSHGKVILETLPEPPLILKQLF